MKMTGEANGKKQPARDEFFTDAQIDLNASFEDALLLEKFDAAQSQLEDFKTKNGETASYIYRMGRLKEKQGQLQAAYELFKRLYFEWPVYMHDKYDYERLQQDIVQARVNKSRALWNQVVAKASRFMEENPEAHGRDNKEPYVKLFWAKQNEELLQVARAFIEVIEFEKFELSSVIALIQCYTELNNKEHQAFYQERLVEARRYWADMNEKRSQAIIAAAKKHEEANRHDAVIEVVNLGLETDPLHAELLLIKAEALQKMRHLKEALACVTAILKNNQLHTRAHRFKKSLEAQIFDQNIRDGLDYLYQAEHEKPGSAAQLTRIDVASSRFIDALGYDGRNLTALAGIYRCHIRAGQPLKAQKTLERIREIDSTFDVYSIFRDKADSESKNELCFVATRVYGVMHPDTVLLRELRDQHLRSHPAGRVFIAFYRRIGPRLSTLPESSPLLTLCRKLVGGIVYLLRQV